MLKLRPGGDIEIHMAFDSVPVTVTSSMTVVSGCCRNPTVVNSRLRKTRKVLICMVVVNGSISQIKERQRPRLDKRVYQSVRSHAADVSVRPHSCRCHQGEELVKANIIIILTFFTLLTTATVWLSWEYVMSEWECETTAAATKVERKSRLYEASDFHSQPYMRVTTSEDHQR